MINRFTVINPDGSFTHPVPFGGILNSSSVIQQAHQFRPTINYTKDFNHLHTITGIAGAEVRSATMDQNGSTGYGYNRETRASVSAIDYSTFFSLIPFGSEQIRTNQRFIKSYSNFISYFANALYEYDKQYQISISARTDRSNLFGVRTNQKSVPLYTAGLSWIVSNIKNFQLPWVSNLKLRLNYGYQGNINYAATGVTTITQQSEGSYLMNQPWATIITNGNPELRWERVRKVNLGVDFSLFKSSIFGSFDVYSKKGLTFLDSLPCLQQREFRTFTEILLRQKVMVLI